MTADSRSKPNILITGTPGTGKTTTSELVALATGLEHVNVGSMVKEHGLHEGFDDQYESYILDEDKLCDQLGPKILAGGIVLDFHSCDFFPEDWFDLIVVLKSDNSILYDRLEKRGYPVAKVQENVQCEIMQVILEEAREAYPETMIVDLDSNTAEEMESNVDRIQQWIDQWTANQ